MTKCHLRVLFLAFRIASPISLPWLITRTASTGWMLTGTWFKDPLLECKTTLVNSSANWSRARSRRINWQTWWRSFIVKSKNWQRTTSPMQAMVIWDYLSQSRGAGHSKQAGRRQTDTEQPAGRREQNNTRVVTWTFRPRSASSTTSRRVGGYLFDGRTTGAPNLVIGNPKVSKTIVACMIAAWW